MPVETFSNPLEVKERKEAIKDDIEEFKEIIKNKFNPEMLAKIHEALNLMLKIHLQQSDRADGEPYAKHPLAVAKKLIEIDETADSRLIISALLHDSAEDMPEVLFSERANRKFPNRHNNLQITQEIQQKYAHTLKEWAFKELRDLFGKEVEYYLRNLTNHDFDSLAEDLSDLSDIEKLNFKHQSYARHIEEIIEDPDLCLLKYADLSQNMDLQSLSKKSKKYFKLKRKYSSVIPIFIDKLKKINSNHPLYQKREEMINELEDVYQSQYSD